MTSFRAVAVVGLLAVAPGLILAQSQDAAAERARLGNERIQAEAERRAQEELELRNRASDAAPKAQAARTGPAQAPTEDRPARPPRPAVDADRTERALEQLGALGKLKDAGYLTDDEFQRIKQRILDSHF